MTAGLDFPMFSALIERRYSPKKPVFHSGRRMNLTKRKVSCTFKRETPLEIQERIYLLAQRVDVLPVWRYVLHSLSQRKGGAQRSERAALPGGAEFS